MRADEAIPLVQPSVARGAGPAASQTVEPLQPRTAVEALGVGALADGRELTVPVHRVRGEQDGAKLGLIALLHGDETFPNEVIRQVLASLDPYELRGEVVALPVSHGLALETLTRNSPIDMLDLNRSFPGDRGGWITEQIAFVISSFLLSEVDALIDLHSGGVFATVDYVYTAEHELELALALGCEQTYRAAASHPGGLIGVAARAGVPAAILELGGGHGFEESLLAKGVRAVRNAMKHLDMIDGERELAGQQRLFSTLETLRPQMGGMFYPEIRVDRLGGVVAAGELLGRVVSPVDYSTLEEFRCPFDEGRVVLLRPAIARINPGEFAYMIGDVASEEPA